MAKKKKEASYSSTSASVATKVSSSSSAQPLDSDSSAPAQTGKPDGTWSGGSWRGKATAIAEVARENVAIAASTASNRVSKRSEELDTTPQRLSRSFRTPSKSSPSAASMTRLNITSNGQEESQKSGKDNEVVDDDKNIAEGTQASVDTSKDDRPLPSAGWRGWWTQSGGSEKPVTHEETVQSKAQNGGSTSDPAQPGQSPPAAESTFNQTLGKDSAVNVESRSSWFGLWSSGQDSPNQEAKSSPKKSRPSDPSLFTEVATGKSVTSDATSASLDIDTKQDGSEKIDTSNLATRPNSGGWAFWSREKPEDSKGAAGQVVPGELAVADTPSQSKPEVADIRDIPASANVASQNAKRKDRPQSLNLVEESSMKKLSADKASSAGAKLRSEANTPDGSPAQPSTPQLAAKDAREKPRPKSLKSAHPNQVLPDFRSTYRVAETPSYWQQLSRIIGRGTTVPSQLAINPSPPRVQKALAIGVHGYVPAPLIQKVLGQPTGTSIRFANEAAAAIQKWTSDRNQPCEIEKIALEGEGMISDRVEILWKLLLNWIDQIRKADFILVSCHSQGVPVAVMLMAKLIDFGCISSTARIGICAMAGVNLGPFSDYKSRFFGGSAAELFEFSRPNSPVSLRYLVALKTVLAHSVRIVYTGSIDDQLVSLESSTFSTIGHPYIYRAVFVDGRIHAPDFITHLVGFALKLRNMGVSDHGLIRELSSPLAGSLYTGEGHSRIYEDQSVYDLAVEFTLETTMVPTVDLEVRKPEPASSTAANPYFLPWAMRGALEEEVVRTELKEDTEQLLKQFEDWKPSSKGLKDVKFRLEAVKSKLA